MASVTETHKLLEESSLTAEPQTVLISCPVLIMGRALATFPSSFLAGASCEASEPFSAPTLFSHRADHDDFHPFDPPFTFPLAVWHRDRTFSSLTG